MRKKSKELRLLVGNEILLRKLKMTKHFTVEERERKSTLVHAHTHMCL